jgi:hypothetical protein
MRDLTDMEQQLVDRLSTLHGKVRLAMESSGLHLYLDSPYVVREEGVSALGKLKASVNLDQWSGTKKPPARCKTPRDIKKWSDACGYCHKTSRVLTVSQLLNVKALGARLHTKKAVVVDIKEAAAEAIESPGVCVPVHELPRDHPAVWYLHSRCIDVATAVQMCRMAFCLEEAPETGERRKRMPGNWKITPAGRVLAFAENGGWVARLVEKNEDGKRWVWHPYESRWDEISPDFKLSKVINARGFRKAEALVGLEAITDTRAAFLVEGCFDALKLGIGAVACLGSSISETQADLLTKFGHVVVVPDNDAAGEHMASSAKQKLIERGVKVTVHRLPETTKDAGDLSLEAVSALKQQYLNKT